MKTCTVERDFYLNSELQKTGSTVELHEQDFRILEAIGRVSIPAEPVSKRRR